MYIYLWHNHKYNKIIREKFLGKTVIKVSAMIKVHIEANSWCLIYWSIFNTPSGLIHPVIYIALALLQTLIWNSTVVILWINWQCC